MAAKLPIHPGCLLLDSMKKIILYILCTFCIIPVSAQKSHVDSIWIHRADVVKSYMTDKGLLHPTDEFCFYTMGGYKYVFLIRDGDSFKEAVYWRDREPELRNLSSADVEQCRRLFGMAKANPIFEYSDRRYEKEIYYTMMYLGIYSDSCKIFEFVLPDHKLSKGKDGLKYPLPRDMLLFLGEKLLLEE